MIVVPPLNMIYDFIDDCHSPSSCHEQVYFHNLQTILPIILNQESPNYDPPPNL